jgi:two-component system, OmpR family, sensor histidine kinase CreC
MKKLLGGVLRLGLGLRLLFGFFLITGLAAVLLLRVFLAEVKPSVREVMEDVLIDTANLLAEQAAPELKALPPGGDLRHSRFAQSVADYRARPINATIWGHTKTSLDFRISLTDEKGRVVFESQDVAAAGEDRSRWNDVARTLRGEYGARSTREVKTDDSSSVMHVAAAVKDGDRIIGVLTVAKPMHTVQPFIDRAERKIWWAGAALLAASIGVGVLVTWWTIHSVRTLRRYAERVSLHKTAGGPEAPPLLPGELGDLAQAMDRMRHRLEARDQVEHAVRAFTHELKTPLAAIQGAAELLHDELPAADRERFAAQIGEQTQRLRGLVDRTLELSKLDAVQALVASRIELLPWLQSQTEAVQALAEQRGVQLRWVHADAATAEVDAERLALAVSNLLANALDFAPHGSAIELSLLRRDQDIEFSVRDHGPGVPDYALPRLGERYFSLVRDVGGQTVRGNGLGLAIVRQVALLHGAVLQFENAQPGLRAHFTFASQTS